MAEKEKIKIELINYHYKCGDGCCDEYGAITKINGKELDFRNDDRATIIKGILKHLGYEVELHIDGEQLM